MLSIQRPAVVARPQFGNTFNVDVSMQKRQEVFQLLENHAKETIGTLWSRKNCDSSNNSGNIAIGSLLQAYVNMASYMLPAPGKPTGMPS